MKQHLFLKGYHFGLVIKIYNKIPVEEHFETGVVCVKLPCKLNNCEDNNKLLQVESRESFESVKCICHMNKLNSLGVLEEIIYSVA